jgi:hypothetical protein
MTKGVAAFAGTAKGVAVFAGMAKGGGFGCGNDMGVAVWARGLRMGGYVG